MTRHLDFKRSLARQGSVYPQDVQPTVIGEREVGKAPRIGSLDFAPSALSARHVSFRGHARPERLTTSASQEIGPSSRKYQKHGTPRSNGLAQVNRMDEPSLQPCPWTVGKSPSVMVAVVLSAVAPSYSVQGGTFPQRRKLSRAGGFAPAIARCAKGSPSRTRTAERTARVKLQGT